MPLDNLIIDLEKMGWKKFLLVRNHANLAVDRNQLLKKLSEINQHAPYDFIQKYVDEIYQHSTSSLFSENKRIFDLIRQGKYYGRYKVNFLHSE